ncbi:sigma-70 family RNA polymerase sigma factor [Pseudomonas aeruginosa]|uniref:RNA polymerase sigma factor n=1 Tax=Pseudomonas aeruginosa TaxID=287 RepID=UPI000EB2EBD8|nr:sigma-70 family RNA polymerase sigma factor [Pseudomonas aeruginosa]ELV1373749.1 sigma-70 family RNA polymerase sigma factor [Pseudomonas aeruginosa]MCX3418079.1 sigma-70 family RNA polymerase sigma factor [Pseudomonas aeruginosa]MDE9770048.1 sigma-70 family RNA polymerase sigma factor [Pseudomonas aeruginosa]TSC47803.1 sigma-70 family RNA polymerase sigma factor [Pseudomonas aeruginosa]HBO3127239.1 sigma-70 family RNA polymerase sigma factor [Pseudomonas aeruginosa]
MDYEQDLVKRLRRGESNALEEVIKLHHAFLVAMTTPLVGPSLADDVAQETWLKAFAAIGQFEGRAKLRTWLARIAINEARALRRKHWREVSVDGWGTDSGSPISSRFNEQGAWNAPPTQWHHDTPEELLTEAELHECIRKHLHKLPGDQQSVVMMRELGGLDYGEIAQALGLAEGNIRVLLHRGRQRMHAMLNHFEEVGTC